MINRLCRVGRASDRKPGYKKTDCYADCTTLLQKFLITFKVSSKKNSFFRMPLRMGVLNLVHELLHSFGASHDPDHCSPENIRRDGRFIMSKYSSSGTKKNNEVISNCTAASVTTTLANKVRCLLLMRGLINTQSPHSVMKIKLKIILRKVSLIFDRK